MRIVGPVGGVAFQLALLSSSRLSWCSCIRTRFQRVSHMVSDISCDKERFLDLELYTNLY